MKRSQTELFLPYVRSRKNKPTFRDTPYAVIYTRVSSKEQAEKNASLDTQRKYCLQFAERNQLEVVGQFGGTYESAKSDERKEFKRMITHVKRHRNISHIIVFAYDRFTRTGPNGVYISAQLKKLGITILAVTQPLDTRTPDGELQQNNHFLYSQWENQVRTNRMTTGMMERLREGYWPLHPPLGYTNLNPGTTCDRHQIVVNEDGKLLAKAWKWKIKENISNKAIVERLNRLGLKINERKLSYVFRNPFYCGKIVCSFIEGEVVDGKHEAMITESEFHQVNAILAGRFEKGRHSKTVGESLPLKRFLKCHSCGAPYTGYLQKQKHILYYRCRTKGCCKNHNGKRLHQQFASFLGRYRLSEVACAWLPEILEKVFLDHHREDRERLGRLKTNLGKVKAKLEQLEERFAEGEVNKSLFDKYWAKFQAERQAIETDLQHAKSSQSDLKAFQQWAASNHENLGKIWEQGSATARIALQRLLFPQGVVWDQEKSEFVAYEVNQLFLSD